MAKTVYRSTWIVTAESESTKRDLTIVCETPEEALRLFAGTIFGRSGKHILTELRRGGGVYVEESNDTSDND